MSDDPQGTFTCPICGHDKPHHHPDEQVAAYREDQMRRDGWTSAAHRQPKDNGWYLCCDVEIDLDQYGEPTGFNDRHPKWSQLSWFLWVRQAEHAPHFGPGIGGNAVPPEVLYFNSIDGWRLRNFLGNAVSSGAESRFAVRASPKYWRDLPDGPRKISVEAANLPVTRQVGVISMSIAWLLESDMPGPDGEILYLCDAPDGYSEPTSMTRDPNAARKFGGKQEADSFRRAMFSAPVNVCRHCRRGDTDGRLLALHPKEHEWPDDEAPHLPATETKD